MAQRTQLSARRAITDWGTHLFPTAPIASTMTYMLEEYYAAGGDIECVQITVSRGARDPRDRVLEVLLQGYKA